MTKNPIGDPFDFPPKKIDDELIMPNEPKLYPNSFEDLSAIETLFTTQLDGSYKWNEKIIKSLTDEIVKELQKRGYDKEKGAGSTIQQCWIVVLTITALFTIRLLSNTL